MKTIFLEILYLIYLLLFTTPNKYRLLETRKMRYFPISHCRYMMWCGMIIYKEEFKQWSKDRLIWMRLNIRLYQAKIFSSTWFTFYLRYWLDILIGSWFCNSFKGGFWTSPYIIEEWVKEENDYYLYDYDKTKMKKYKFTYSERGVLWRECGKNKEKWIGLMKEL